MNPVTQGLHRFSGIAAVNGEPKSFSVIRKTMGLDPAGGPNPSIEMSNDPRHWNYWKRELFAYRSGYLPATPNALRTPKLLASNEPDETHAEIWLEELTSANAEHWSPERAAIAARQLGTWQATVGGASMSSEPWFSRRWLRSLIPTRMSTEAVVVADGDYWRSPLVKELFDPALQDRVARIWEGRDVLLDGLSQSPQTLSHFDFRPANLFEGDSPDETAIIDWQFLGEGAFGQDLVGLTIDGVLMNQFPPAELIDRETLVLDAYVAGLVESGWDGSPDEVQFAYAATAAVRFGPSLGWLLQLATDPERAEAQVSVYNRPIEDLLRERVVAVDRALSLGERALQRLS